MQLLRHGAEARLFLTNYMGRKAVLKMRERKNYRALVLDDRILKERLRTECLLLSRAKKAGVRTPMIWKIDPGSYSITTEFIQGRTMKQEISQNPKKAEAICRDAGENVARLHSADIIHGDLTTGNIIIRKNRLVILDFGLGQVSSKVEDKAVDLLAFKKTFLATHFMLAGQWQEIEEAYVQGYTAGKNVLKQMQKVEARARYFES